MRRGVLSGWLSSSPPLHSAHSDGNILGGERLIGSGREGGCRWESVLLPAGRVRERGDDGRQLEALLEMKSVHEPQLTEEPDGWNIRLQERRCVSKHRCFQSIRRPQRSAALCRPAPNTQYMDNRSPLPSMHHTVVVVQTSNISLGIFSKIEKETNH